MKASDHREQDLLLYPKFSPNDSMAGYLHSADGFFLCLPVLKIYCFRSSLTLKQHFGSCADFNRWHMGVLP